jgi:hypothetical protein
MSAFPVVGEIYQPAPYQPPFTQPGGPGTTVYPVQQTGELVGQFTAGCSHSFNNWLVLATTAANGDQVAVLCCPYCHYVQQIIDPFSNIYTWPFEILIG